MTVRIKTDNGITTSIIKSTEKTKLNFNKLFLAEKEQNKNHLQNPKRAFGM